MKHLQWHETRFIESSAKTRCDCVQCGRAMWFPPSKAGKYLTCGEACSAARREALKARRSRRCLTCGVEFFPRTTQIKSGGGKYCSIACFVPEFSAAGHTPEAREKRGRTRRAAFEAGTMVPMRGAANGRWKGGKQASIQRRTASGKLAQQRREYRARNPEKVREWRQKRRGIGRLPRGTIQRLGAAQRWKCAICRVGVKNGYHVDHILPLALGGEHAPGNLQLLCGPCNVRKSAKHPVDFMQSQGFLL